MSSLYRFFPRLHTYYIPEAAYSFYDRVMFIKRYCDTLHKQVFFYFSKKYIAVDR